MGNHPLECWCLFSVKLTLWSVVILQIDGVFRCVSPGFQGNNTQEGDHLKSKSAFFLI